MASLGHFYETLDSNPLPVWLHNLKHALIKTCSTKAKGRTPIMPTSALNTLFGSWADNELLSIKKLRQKCVSLLALAGMCRPSDLTKFKRNDIIFNNDGSVTIMYFGIKKWQKSQRVWGPLTTGFYGKARSRCSVKFNFTAESPLARRLVTRRSQLAGIETGSLVTSWIPLAVRALRAKSLIRAVRAGIRQQPINGCNWESLNFVTNHWHSLGLARQ